MSKSVSITLYFVFGIISLLIPYFVGYFNATRNLNFFVMIFLFAIALVATEIRYRLIRYLKRITKRKGI